MGDKVKSMWKIKIDSSSLTTATTGVAKLRNVTQISNSKFRFDEAIGIMYVCMYVCVCKGWANKSGLCTTTFNDPLVGIKFKVMQNMIVDYEFEQLKEIIGNRNGSV
jgi:hypothetical protein